MHINIDDDIISFHQADTIFMYYNKTRQTITLLAVCPAYNVRHLLNNDMYLFYDFTKTLEHSQKSLMSYNVMIANVYFILEHFNIDVPKNVKFRVT